MSQTGADNQMDGANLREIRARAAKWREHQDRPDWNTEEQGRLDTWLAESPAHRVAYLRVDSVWERADRLSALRGAAHDIEQPPVAGRISTPLIKTAIALVMMAMLGTGVAFFALRPSEQVYATTIGGHETLTLDDGSQVELNTDTLVRVSYSASQRTVLLDRGEAYFQVTHNPARPFVVTAGSHRIVDLGTKFLVRRDQGRIEVALMEGRARLEKSDGNAQSSPTILAPGDVVVVTANSVTASKKSSQSLAGELGWRNGMLVFRNTSIVDVAEELNRYNRKKLVVADPAVARLTIGATIPTNGIEAFTRVAREVFGLHVVNQGDEIVISR